MSDSLRDKTSAGVLWAFAERIGMQVVGFVVSVILARLLTPSDYGVIGMLTVFLSISQMFIDCGFGSALIRKKERTEEDFATVFWYNLGISCFCYLILFLAAPLIADFYSMPILKSVLRVVGLNLIIHALYTIQVTRLTALVNFSLQAKITVSSNLVSGCIGITLAYCGYGVWALVGQTMSAAVFSGIMYWLFTGWRPRFLFSKKFFRELFGFGSKIMAAGFLHTIYMNISPLIIGRKFSAADLGYYSRGDSLAALPGGIFQSTLGRVIFPVLSSIQDDEARLQRTYNKYLRIITSLVAPSMLLLAACAEPLIMLLIGEKWLPCVPYLQLLAIAWVCDPIILVNLNILYVKGRSDVVLKLEIIKKIIAILIVVIAVQYGVIWLCVGRVFYSYIALILNIRYCGPFLEMGFWRQIKEVKEIYISGLLAAFLAFIIVQYTKGIFNIFGSITLNSLLRLIIAAVIGGFVYFVLAWIQKFDFIEEVRQFIKKRQRIEQ